VTADPGARRASGYALVALAAMSWGTWPLILRHAPMPPALQSAVLMLVITVASLPVMLGDRVRVRPTAMQWAGVAWLGIGDALNVVLLFAAYQRTSVAIAVLTHYLTPIFVALAAPLVLRERAGPRTFAAVTVAFCGLVLLLQPWGSGVGRNELVGAALGAGSAVFYASNVLVNKRLVKAFSGSELMFFHGVVGTPLLFALVPPSEYALVSRDAVLVVLGGALGPGALGGLLFVWGLRRIAASQASVLTLLEPFVAVILASAWMGQRLGPLALAGGGLILAGAVLVVTGGPGGKGRPGRPSKEDDAPGDRVESTP
jgi:drug/metabolite transporter (DMT)-like permease